MTEHVKKVLDQYRQKYERPSRTEVVSFRVTPDELALLKKVYGDYTGIRDFALASTDTGTYKDILEGIETETEDGDKA